MAVPAETQSPFSPPSEEFVQLFTQTQRRLYLLILSQVPRPGDAEEILQNCNLVLWSKCSQYRPGTNFFSWAARVATLEILKFRQKHARDRLQFSDEFLEAVTLEAETESDALDRRREALAVCLSKLRPQDRQLIQQRYAPGGSGLHVADQLHRPVNAVYQSLGRIRRALLECIQRQLSAAELGST
jgi:RNA polymerase sigma-70 factor (ECF subfamily)